MRIITGICAAVLCVSCLATNSYAADTGGWMAEPGKFASYRDALSSALMEHMSGKATMPSSVRQRLASCYADLAVSKLSGTQIRAMDAAARGEKPAPKDVSDQVHQTLAGAVPAGKRGDFTALEPICPKDIPDFQRYAQQ